VEKRGEAQSAVTPWRFLVWRQRHGLDDQARSANRLGGVTFYEIGLFCRGLHDLNNEGVGRTLADVKALLAELQQPIVQDQVLYLALFHRVFPTQLCDAGCATARIGPPGDTM
jgi:hypothetical protein